MCVFFNASFDEWLGLNKVTGKVALLADLSPESMKVAHAYNAAPLKDKKMVCLTLDLPEPVGDTECKPNLNFFNSNDSETSNDLSPEHEAALNAFREELDAVEKGTVKS